MADALYPDGKQTFLRGDVAMDTDTIKVALVNTSTDYTYSAAHNFLDDVTVYAGTTDQTLSSKTVTDGVFDDTAGVTFSSVAISGGKTVSAIILYRDSGSAATSALIAYYDSFGAITPNGTDITVTPHASGFFAL